MYLYKYVLLETNHGKHPHSQMASDRAEQIRIAHWPERLP